jgi:cell division initiation protein
MALNKEEIINKKFKTSMGGYNKLEVEVYLEWLADEVEKVLADNAELKRSVEEMSTDHEKFLKEKQSFNEDQSKAKQDIERIKRETAKFCEQERLDARTGAQNILKDSYKKLKGIKTDIDKLQAIKNSFITRYQSYLKDQLESIKAFQKENYDD